MVEPDAMPQWMIQVLLKVHVGAACAAFNHKQW